MKFLFKTLRGWPTSVRGWHELSNNTAIPWRDLAKPTEYLRYYLKK